MPHTYAAADTIPISQLTEAEILDVLTHYNIGLTVEEAQKIVELLGRDPTLTEAVIWGIQGSEHCSYKSSRRFLKTFVTDGPHIILGPKEDSGIVAITDGPEGKRWGLVVTHESHNKPSQVVSFEGAATGVGGTVRDVVCMGARVIGCMDMLRLGDLDSEETRTIASEVIRGIAGYGNPLGIPNLGGDTVFDEAYNKQCLVNAVALGIVREDEVVHSYAPPQAGTEGYDIIIVGKPTDRSGFGGASFASANLEDKNKKRNTGAVQEPNPFLERHLLASTYALFDWLAATGKLDQISCKDLGAGGVVCASVEQLTEHNLGATVELDQLHVALDDVPPEVIACAETQERLCFMCHPSLTNDIVAHYNDVWDLPSVAENARASVVGTVNDTGRYTLTYQGKILCDATAEAITCGLQYERPTALTLTKHPEPNITCADNTVTIDQQTFTIEDVFTTLLAHPNHASKAAAIKHYDKNVIGNTIVEAGEADAGVIAPLQDLASYVHEGEHPGWEIGEADQWRGVAVAADGNGRYGRIDPYWQGVNATVEAMRNVVAVGAVPRALTDCLNYSDPEVPAELAALEAGVRGIAAASREITFDNQPVPIISGNVSLYNRHIDPTAVVCCVGVLPDARQAVNMQLKQAGSALVCIGSRKNECGGSAYYQILEQLTGAVTDTYLGTNVPHPDFAETTTLLHTILDIHQKYDVRSCHDISDGGLLLAAFEMTLPQRKLGGEIGLTLDLQAFDSELATDTLLFSETGGFLLETDVKSVEHMITYARDHALDAHVIGTTLEQPEFRVIREATEIIVTPLPNLHSIWQNGLKNALQSM